MAEDAQPGVRVKVRFAGQDVDGFVIERAATTEHTGTAAAAPAGGQPRAGAHPRRRGADRRRRREVRRHPVRRPAPRRPAAARDGREAGRASRRRRSTPTLDPELVAALRRAGRAPRRRWPRASRRAPCGPSLPGDDWADLLAEAVVATALAGRGALVCVPDHRDLDRLDAALTARLGRGPPRRARRRRRPGEALPRVPGGRARGGPGRHRHPRGRVRAGAATSGWWRSGTTATTSTTSRGRRTPTPARCCSCAPRRPAARRCWPPTPAASRRSTSCAPAGPPRSPPRARWSRERISVGLTGDSDRDLRARRRAPARRGCPARRHACCATPCSTARCWCRRRASATPPGWPATAAVRRPLCTVCHGPLRLRGPSRPPGVRLVRAPRRPAGPAPSAADAACARPVLGDARTAEEIGRALPGVPVRAVVVGRARDRRGRRQAGDRRRHAGGRAGGAGRLRRRAAARHLAAARPRRPARHRGGDAPLGQRRRPGAPARRRRAACWRSGSPPTRACRR